MAVHSFTAIRDRILWLTLSAAIVLSAIVAGGFVIPRSQLAYPRRAISLNGELRSTTRLAYRLPTN